jgi:hypothetical protein
VGRRQDAATTALREEVGEARDGRRTAAPMQHEVRPALTAFAQGQLDRANVVRVELEGA